VAATLEREIAEEACGMEVEMNKDGGGWERRRRWRGFKAPAMGEQRRRNRGHGSVGDDERIILVRKKKWDARTGELDTRQGTHGSEEARWNPAIRVAR
jgi:hypothetical protein